MADDHEVHAPVPHVMTDQEFATAQSTPLSEAPTDEQAADNLGPANYDAQADLALPSRENAEVDGFAPFGGSVVPDHTGDAGYDVERDTGR